MNDLTLDMLHYNGISLPNTPFNRAAILTVESFITAVARSRLLTERTPRIISNFIIGHAREFTILADTPLEDFAGFWEEAGTTQTGPGIEYMVTPLMEIYSVFLTQVDAKDAQKLVVKLFPQMPKMQTEKNPELAENYNNSQAYVELPDQSTIEKAVEAMRWVTPWLILSHCNHRLLEYLLNYLDKAGQVPEAKQDGQEEPEPQ